jgi:hypothetical protein
MKGTRTEIEFLRATIYLHEVEPRTQTSSALNRFSTEPDVAHRMLWNVESVLSALPPYADLLSYSAANAAAQLKS